MRKLIAALFVAGALIGAGWYLTQRSVPIEMVRAQISPTTWATYRKTVTDAKPVAADVLIAAVVQANRSEVAGGADPRTSPSFLAAANRVRTEAWQFVQRRSPEAFVQLGRQRGVALIDAVDALLAWCAKSGMTLEAALAMPNPPTPVSAYIDLGGGFVRFAQDTGFIVDGTLRDMPFVQALFLRHWMAPLAQSMPLDAFVTRDERTWHLQWKVEAQTKGTLESRLAAAEELRNVIGYPSDLNAGVLLHQAGRLDEARARFKAASEPQAKAYLRALGQPTSSR